MEKRSHVLSKALYMAILFVFYLNIVSAQCQNRRTKHISPSQFEPPNFKSKFRRISLSILFGIITGFIFAFLFALLVRFFIKYINRTPIIKDPIVFTPQISPRTLQSALENEPQLLGSSPNGKYYKAVLDNGLTVAVKRLEPINEVQNRETKRNKKKEFEILSGLRHRNLMCLRAYVHESGGYSLVYDYMPNGSLGDVMKGVTENQLQLKWESRLRIAVGIVKGLHFLHFTCDPRRMHYNLKPSNVLLGSEFEPKLTDWGLAPVISNFHRAASGYNAPECFQNCRYTDKSDVYSFGVILGFLLTGKDPLDPFFGEPASGGSLVQWLRHLQQAGEAREALDKSILGEEMEEDEMKMAVRIAVVCLSDLPADRPSSDELVSMLTQLNSF